MSYEAFHIMEDILGFSPRSEGQSSRMYNCPFHDDHNASLKVMSDGAVMCYAHCVIDGRSSPRYSSIVGLVMQLKGITFLEAKRLIGLNERIDYQTKPQGAMAKKYNPPMWMVMKHHEGLHRSLEYLEKRGIPHWYAKKMLLGAYPYKMSKKAYVGGKLFDRLPVLRHTIPCLSSNRKKAFNIAMRLDENDARKRIGRLPVALVDELLELLSDKGVDNLEKEMMTTLFGPKYLTLGTEIVIYNSEILGQWVDGEYKPHSLPVVAIVEGQYDAIILNLVGVPAIATKHHPNLKTALAGVERVVIVRDNDDAGELIANTLMTAIGRGEIIVTDEKDVTDTHLAGKLPSFLLENKLIEESALCKSNLKPIKV